MQGNRVLTMKDFQEAVLPPTGLKAFALDACFEGIFPFQQIVGNLPQGCHVLRSMVFANPALVFPEGHVQGPVQPVLDTPVAAHCLQQTLCRPIQAADVVPGLLRGSLVRIAKDLIAWPTPMTVPSIQLDDARHFVWRRPYFGFSFESKMNLDAIIQDLESSNEKELRPVERPVHIKQGRIHTRGRG